MSTAFILLSLVAGSLLALQAGANAQLSKAVDSPMAATTLQLGIGALLLLGVTVLTGTLSALPLLSGAPWWHIIGGVASAFYVVSTILLFPRIGAATTVGLTVAGQQIASLFVDRYGWFMLPEREISGLRFAGVALLLLGVAILQIF